MNKKLLLLLIALLFLLAPPLVKWGWFYPVSGYKAPTIAEIDPAKISSKLPEYNQSFTDEPIKGQGEVIIDLTHDNNLQINDFGPIRTRLEARGVTVITMEGEDSQTLAEKLRKATGLIVVAPTLAYSAEERETIVKFVADGGQLLLAADPTRPVPPKDTEFMSLFDIFFPQSAVPAVNSLATAFGLTYVDDFLYSLDNNAGNYRNIKFTKFAKNPLADKLKTVELLSAYSILGDGESIIQGDEHINSLVRTNEQGLSGAILAANKQVLALGDVTMLTPPYNTLADNNQFLSNIANWLAHDKRIRDLEDFPYLFTSKTINLVQTDVGFLDPRLIAETSVLQESFSQADLKLALSSVKNVGKDNDVIYVGTFEQTDMISPYLKTAGISITVVITPTDELTKTDTVSKTDKATPKATATATATITSTGKATTTVRITPTPKATPEDETDLVGDTQKKNETEPDKVVTIDIASMGQVNGVGSTLFVVDRQGDQVVLIALAEDSESAIAALNRLTEDDFSQCAMNGNLMLCSTGEVLDVATPTEEATKSTLGDKLGKVFILSSDNGLDGTRTGAADWDTILSEDYEVMVWSVTDDGNPTSDDITGYDVYIIDSGDYAPGEDLETFAAFSSIEDGAGVMFIGSQPLPTPLDSADVQPLSDLEVSESDHPILKGFDAGTIITLEPSEGGVDPVVIPNPEDLYTDAIVLFNRGPDSRENGTPVVIAAVDSFTESRVVLATFPFFRLPETERTTFGLNAINWLLANKDKSRSDNNIE